MDSNGQIYTAAERKALAAAADRNPFDKRLLKKLEGLVAVPDEALDKIRGMNRKQRRKWYAEQRAALKARARAAAKDKAT
jgi:hypothetical protein